MRLQDMTTGSPLGLILRFAIPLFIGNIFQQFYNMVVGYHLGGGAGSEEERRYPQCRKRLIQMQNRKVFARIPLQSRYRSTAFPPPGGSVAACAAKR